MCISITHNCCILCILSVLRYACGLLLVQMNDRKGHRRLRLTSRKHFKPKPKLPKSLWVSISKKHVSVLKVSLPVELLNFHVSVPVTSFLNAPVSSVSNFQQRLQFLDKVNLPVV